MTILPSYVEGQWWTPDAATARPVRDATTGEVVTDGQHRGSRPGGARSSTRARSGRHRSAR